MIEEKLDLTNLAELDEAVFKQLPEPDDPKRQAVVLIQIMRALEVNDARSIKASLYRLKRAGRSKNFGCGWCRKEKEPPQ